MSAIDPDIFYNRSQPEFRAGDALDGDVQADVCIIGGGLAGLATALGLAERGRKVALLEARRIGYGASGRNGGFCLSGYAASPQAVVKKAGLENARALYALSRDAQKLIKKRIASLGIDCQPVAGSLVASWTDDAAALRRKQEYLCAVIGERAEFWPREKIRGLYATAKYYDGLFFPDNFHMDPLAYARGIARAVRAAGGMIFEESAVVRVDTAGDRKTIHTASGRVLADHVVYCGSAYFVNAPEKRLARACLPIATYVMVTEPIDPELLRRTIAAPYAIRDSRYADDYYRPLPGNRLLWGGRISLGRDPADIAACMRRDMARIYPQLAGVKAQTAWSGLMGYTVHRMPLVGRFAPGVWYCTNFGGNGVGPTTAGGEVIARAIAQDDETYKLFEPFGFDYTGGLVGPLVAQAVYRSWEMSDWLAEIGNRVRRYVRREAA